MKTTLYITVALASLSTSVLAQQTESSNEKPVKLEINIPINEQPQRNLFLVPFVTIEGRTLRFYDNFNTDVHISVALNDGNADNPTVVYSGAKTPEESQHLLPASLSGTYTIYITIDNTLYYGEITIE